MQIADGFVIFPHQPTEGKIVFQGQGVGDPSQVRVEALQNGNVVATAAVGRTPNPDGSYTYVFPGPLTAGTYTVRATYLLTNEVQQGTVTVPDDCTPAQNDPATGSIALDPKGSHGKVTGPTLTLQRKAYGGPPGGGG